MGWNLDPSYMRRTVLPTVTNSWDIGSASLKIKDIYQAGNLYTGGNIVLSAASAKIIPGATSLLIRNNADSATNLSIADNGNIIGLGVSWLLGATAGSNVIFACNTADGSDAGTFSFCGGGSNDRSRGGYIQCNGNEASAGHGVINYICGNSSTSGVHNFFTGNQLLRWTLDTNGTWFNDSTNGGNVQFVKAQTSVVDTVDPAIATTGTTISDAYALTKVVNVLATGAAGTGAKLWDAPIGTEVVVTSINPNTVKLYAPSGGNIYSQGSSMNIAQNDNRILKRADATNWTLN